MFKRLVALLFTSLLLSQTAAANSETPFPGDWRDWTSVSTPLTRIGVLPGCDADVSALPPIYQETVEIYCGIRPQGPGAVEVLVKPDAGKTYKVRNGQFSDGSLMILHLKELGVLFVTGNQSGKPTYGVFKTDGTDITNANPDSPLGVNTCRVCHSGYAAFCVSGQCGTAK